jgi:hypothetical protein
MCPPSACFYEARLASFGKGPEHLPSFIGLEAFRKNRAFRKIAPSVSMRGRILSRSRASICWSP